MGWATEGEYSEGTSTHAGEEAEAGGGVRESAGGRGATEASVAVILCAMTKIRKRGLR